MTREATHRASLVDLTPAESAAVEAVDVRGLTHAAAGLELGIAARSVAQRLQVARAKLRVQRATRSLEAS